MGDYKLDLMLLATQGQFSDVKGNPLVDGSGYLLYKVEEDIIIRKRRGGSGGYIYPDRKPKKVKRIRLTFQKESDVKVFETIIEDVNLTFSSYDTIDLTTINIKLKDIHDEDIIKEVIVNIDDKS